jgi:ferredoxin
MDSPFEVLGVDPDADETAREEAFRERVKETHPDQGGSGAELRRVLAAYEALADVDPRGETGPTSAASPGTERERDPAEGVGPEADPSEEVAHVEYLNYEVLEDYGWGLDDDDLFEKAADAGLDPDDYGRFEVGSGESVLGAAESCGFAWPYACRGGACANCAVAVREGEMTQPTDHVLPPEMTDRGIRLSCNGVPCTDEMQVVYNVKHLPDLDDLRLPPYPFERAHAGD